MLLVYAENSFKGIIGFLFPTSCLLSGLSVLVCVDLFDSGFFVVFSDEPFLF